jgi:hypothetical protein
MLARPRPGVRRERVAEELDAVYHRPRDVPPIRAATRIVVASPMATVAMGSAIEVRNATLSLWLAAVAGIVLLVACANVASLALTRAVRRQREMAVRLAIGIGRGRLARLLMTESLTLALLGGVAGLVVARWGGSVVRALLIPSTFADVSTFDVRALAVTLVATLVTGIVCGLAPAIRATRPDLTVALKAGEHGSPASRSRLLGGLLVGQIALTLVLLVGRGCSSGVSATSMCSTSGSTCSRSSGRAFTAPLEAPPCRRTSSRTSFSIARVPCRGSRPRRLPRPGRLGTG